MKAQIEAIIQEVGKKYSDKRQYIFDVTCVTCEGDKIILAGKVLEKELLDDLRQQLKARFPQCTLEDETVRVLRSGTPAVRTVATNLTSLHVEPSFQAEMLTQVMNGWALEIVEEKDRWAVVRQMDGYLGWGYLPYLSSQPAPRPTHLVSAGQSLMYVAPRAEGLPLSRLPGGVAVQATEVQRSWARVVLAGDRIPAGWVPLEDLRPLQSLPLPAAEARLQMVEDARRLTGVPYLWGGNSAWGIDCSGLAQWVHRLAGYTLPRDADQQKRAARPIEEPYRPGDLFFFCSDTQRNKITHVGICVGGWNMIHSSRARNGVYEDNVQAVEHLRDTFAGAGTFMEG